MKDSLLLLAILLVLSSGLAHAGWNYFAKQSSDRAVFLWSIMLTASVILAPFFVVEFTRISIPVEGYLLLALSMILQGCYSYLLSKAYTLGDLSQVYPIMRGTGTFLTSLTGVLLLGESLSVWGWLGIFTIILGMFSLQNRTASLRETGLKPLLLAILVGVCICSYVIVDKLALSYLSPWSLLFVSNLGFMAALTPSVMRSARLKAEWSRNWQAICWGSLLSPGSYLLFLFALRLAPVAQLTPIREVGTVFGTLLGILLLKEQQGLRRIMGSIVIAAGIIIIGAAG